jgi:hypothetical protein
LWFLVVVVVVVGLERRWFQNLNPSTQLLVSICCVKVWQAGRQAYLSGFGVFISCNRWQAGARQLF